MEWTEREMNWYNRALNVNEYPDNIVDFIEPLLKDNYHLLDIGCGIGTFTLPLAERVRKVTALDKSKEMLKYLGERSLAKDLQKKLELKLLDWKKVLPGREFDSFNAILTSYSGEEVLADKKSIAVINELARDLVLLFVPTERKRHSFQTDLLFEKLGRSKNKHVICFSDVKDILKEMGIKFSSRNFVYNFGQPFASFLDAVEFFAFHYQLKEAAEIKILKFFLEGKLVDRDDYLWIDNFKTSTLIWWEN